MNAYEAISDETRRDIVTLVAERGELPASAISREFDMSAPAISQHLKILREAGVLRMKKDAQRRLYSLNPSGMDEVSGWVLDVIEVWHRRMDRLDAHLAKMKKER